MVTKPKGALGAFALAMLCSAAFGADASAQDGPVRLGILTPKQGASASIGQSMARGAELAIELHGGKVLGRDIKTVWLDEASPQVAQQNMQKMADDYSVAGVVGGNSSSATLAMMPVAEREKIPFISAGSAASEVTGASCNRYTFRTQAPVPVQVSAVFDRLKDQKLYFMTPSYAFGQDVLRTARSMLDGVGASEAGNDEVPVNTADYSSYILKIRQASPDAVFGALVGLDLSNFLKQWRELGMQGEIPVYEVAVSDTDFWDIGPDASTGIHVKPWYYNDPANPDVEKKFVEAYEEEHGQPPSDKAWSGWFAMTAMLDSIEAAGSTDPKEVVKQIESWTYDAGEFPYYFRKWDHQLIRPSVIVQVKDEITDKWDYMNVIGTSTSGKEDTLKAFGTQEEIGCKMGEL
ncbi:ABC transporter substrate-binding protein [Jiella endophytica]|uniref:ABC transporter substrate-binding protein n=1 Tax=Jiella endophytica TaxID=2558362 RepID=A0A4Y8RBE4_9HYPH|nr:ABC transporter substrate-binding protein [Jiella endophytica]TFF19133.1 ABC transporter substrate-binding protein [Jiella endophytica]